MTERSVQWETVPAGTRSGTCRGASCGREVYRIERPRKNGKPGLARVPVDCDVEGGHAPDSLQDGRGINHFQNCVDAGDF